VTVHAVPEAGTLLKASVTVPVGVTVNTDAAEQSPVAVPVVALRAALFSDPPSVERAKYPLRYERKFESVTRTHDELFAES
jgi:hypothetical protein